MASSALLYPSHKSKPEVVNQHDDKIWLRLKKGDREAFLHVYEAHYEMLYHYGMKLSGDKELTRDCIHEIFVQIWEKGSTLKDVYYIKGYLLTYMRRVMLDKIRLKRLHSELEKHNENEKELKLEFSPEDILIGKEASQEQKERVLEALSQLSPRQKEIVYLKFYYGLDYKTIQQVTSLSYQSLRNLLYKAMVTLRKHLS